MKIKLFADSTLMGVFKGFAEHGLEFAAEIVCPYDASMQDRPQLGQFVLIELGSPEEASLGRITKFIPTGLLTSSQGEDYMNVMQRRQKDVPEDLKEQRLKYRVHLKLLGAVRTDDGRVNYVPSQRRLPHLGASVALPSEAVLSELCALSGGDTALGDFVLGEFWFCGSETLVPLPMRPISPHLKVTFNINNLVSKRSVVFARAGYGKSNLLKFLLAELYKGEPKTASGVPVGTLVFDADGEYFWRDQQGRPGLCNVPHLHDKICVFTNRVSSDATNSQYKAGEVKLDIRQLPANDVVSIMLPAEKQEQQNVQKIRGLNGQNWAALVDLIERDRYSASDQDIQNVLGVQPNQMTPGELAAVRSNMVSIVSTLHDPLSTLLSGVKQGLVQGGLVIVDISLLSSRGGENLAGLILRHIFSHNQENFTGGNPIIPCIVVVEEAQSVLSKSQSESSPFVEWVKEGRKYNLGAILVTQQPGSLAPEILSQADNWFCFHLLSEGDAGVLGKYNSHFSDDILAHLIAEPIPGNCFMWSAPKQPFVLPVRIADFENAYDSGASVSGGTGTMRDPLLASAIRAKAKVGLASLIDELKEKLNEPKAKFVLASDGSSYGIKRGQVFFILKDIKRPEDTWDPDTYVAVTLKALLSVSDLQIEDINGKPHIVATRDAWEHAGIANLPPLA